MGRVMCFLLYLNKQLAIPFYRIRFTLIQNWTVSRAQGPMLTLGNPAGISEINKNNNFSLNVLILGVRISSLTYNFHIHWAWVPTDKACFDNNLTKWGFRAIFLRSNSIQIWWWLKQFISFYSHLTPLESGMKCHLLFQEWSLQVVSQVLSVLTGHHKNVGSIISLIHRFLWFLEASNESPCCLSIKDR